MKTMIIALIVFLGAQCALSSTADAQAGPNCLGNIGNFFDPGGTTLPIFNCLTEGPFLEVCLIWTYNCPAVAGPAENHSKCPACGSPVALADGNTFIEETDVRLPGLSGGLKLVRTWNSIWPATQSIFKVGLFGPNWRSNFEERVFTGSDNFMKYARGDGSFWSFGYGSPDGGGVWSVSAPANISATLTPGTSYWTITFQNGERRLFDNTSGNLTAIIDRNNNSTQLSYDAVSRLTTVTDPASRHLYFSYASGSSYLVTGVTSDFGVSLTYAYDTQGRLILVTNPDLSTIAFSYDSNSFISSVTDSQGKVLESHTYDSSGRGLTSSRALGVDAVTISYGH